VAFSHCGSKVLIGSDDGTAKLWDINGDPKNAADPAVWCLLE
jgi:WD40 repeat protein